MDVLQPAKGIKTMHIATIDVYCLSCDVQRASCDVTCQTNAGTGVQYGGCWMERGGRHQRLRSISLIKEFEMMAVSR